MAKEKKTNKYKTFKAVMKARAAGELKGKLRLVEYTSTGSVELQRILQNDDEDYRIETLYTSETTETFMLDVAKAMGWEGAIS